MLPAINGPAEWDDPGGARRGDATLKAVVSTEVEAFRAQGTDLFTDIMSPSCRASVLPGRS